MTPPVVTLYARPGCHLCEAVHQAIDQVRTRRPFDVVVKNILDDPGDFERYQYAIPVVLLNGVEIARYRLTAAELLRALDDSESGKPRRGGRKLPGA